MKKKYFIVAIFLALLLPVLAYFYLSSQYKKMVVTPNKNTTVTPTVTPTPDPDRPFSVLLLGFGGPGHDGPFLTDSIILARISPKIETVDLISIPRDLWASVPISDSASHSAKINSFYSVGLDDRHYPQKYTEFTGKAGGGELAKKAITKVTGITPDYFIAVDFSAFTKVIDKLGGIDVLVARTFDDPFYPIETVGVGVTYDNCGKTDEEVKALSATMSGEKLEREFPCRYENLHFDRGLQHMDGTTALKFARSRHSPTDGGDFNRSERQKLVIEAIKNKVVSLNFFGKIIPVINTLSYHITTDLDENNMEKYLLRAPEISKYKINSLPISDQNFLKASISSDRQSILIPKAGEFNYQEIYDYLLR